MLYRIIANTNTMRRISAYNMNSFFQNQTIELSNIDKLVPASFNQFKPQFRVERTNATIRLFTYSSFSERNKHFSASKPVRTSYQKIVKSVRNHSQRQLLERLVCQDINNALLSEKTCKTWFL